MLWSDLFTPFVTQLGQSAAFLPPADVSVSESDVVLTMDVPGMTVDDLSIELLGSTLIVRGQRKRRQLPEGTGWHHAERAFGQFERRISVPEGVDPEGITASIDNGVLSLIVPKPERLKPKAIAIGSGNGRRQLETAAA